MAGQEGAGTGQEEAGIGVRGGAETGTAGGDILRHLSAYLDGARHAEIHRLRNLDADIENI